MKMMRVAAVVMLAAGARLAAQAVRDNENLSLQIRAMSLDLLVQSANAASEREAARAERQRLSAATYDADRNGKLDDREFAAWEREVRAYAEKSPALLKKFDRNRDRKLSDAEWAAARRELIGG